MSFRAMRLEWFQRLGIPIVSVIALSANSSVAQITPDGTLPNNSNVRLEGNTRVIEGGTQAASNLFHSFKDFSVPPGSEAFFNNSADIHNIFSRVTGESVSRIDGLIKTNGTANLFLINPNGIIFGKNASLNIGGSFVATTANAIGFGNLGLFSASNPQAPSQLLTINPSALLFNQIAAPIQNNSVAPAAKKPADLNALGLRVRDGKSLLFVGGNITMDGGELYTYGGRVELAGLAEPGTVALTVNQDNLSLSFPDNVARADVSVTNSAKVYVEAAGGGSIAINARNIDILNDSLVSAGIGQGLGLAETVAGDIVLNATGEIKVAGSTVNNRVRAQAKGNGGNLTINTGSLVIRDDARVSADTLGAGNGGNLRVEADEVQVIGRSSNLSARANSNATGDGGNLTINTSSLLIQDGAQVSANTLGAGKGGNLDVNAQTVEVIGSSSALSTQGNSNSTGDAGDLTIHTGSLLIRDEARVSADIFGAGNGGNLTVKAQQVQVIGRSADAQTDSRLSARATAQATGNAGDLTINTGSLLIQNGAQVSANTLGAGKGGNLDVNAQTVEVIGSSSSLSTQGNSNSTGDAGDLTINTGSLLIRDEARVSADIVGAGNGGNLTVKAQQVQVIGRSADAPIGSRLSARATAQATGDVGDLTINTGSLLIQNGAQVTVSTFGAGKGGNLTVEAKQIQVIGRSADGESGSRLSAQASTGSTGDAGDLTINTGSLLIQNGALVSASTIGAGKGGNLSVEAQDVQVIGGLADGESGSNLTTQAEGTGDAGDLTIKTGSLLIQNGARVSVDTFGAGNGGNLKVEAQQVQVIGRSADDESGSRLSARATTQATGEAGDLTIKTGSLLIQDGAQVSVSSATSGQAGNLTVDANSILLDNLAKINADTTGGGGNILINSPFLMLRRGSSITTNASGNDIPGGNITIDGKNGFILAVAHENSDIRADSENFRGGNVTIYNTAGIFGIQPRNEASPNTSDITAKGATPDLSGNIDITSPEVDPRRGLVEIPINLIDASRQISNACTPGSRQYQNMFVATGRGGLPINPTEPLQDLGTLSTWVKFKPQPENSANTTTQPQPTAVSTNSKIAAATPIMEASGWVVDRNGNIELVAQAPQVNPHSSWQASASCPVSQ